MEREYDFGKPLETFGLDARAHYYVLRVAAEWQSPGAIGCELATLASSGRVTDELASDVSKTIRQARAGYTPSCEDSAEYARGIADLKLLADTLGLELDEDVK